MGVFKLRKNRKLFLKKSKFILCVQTPCVNKVMEPHDKQMKLTAFF